MTDKKADKTTLVTQAQTKMVARANSVESMLEGTEAGKLWSEIKDKPLEMFALPGQTINQHAQPFPVEPSKLYLVTRASSALPAIETALGNTYTVELVDKYVVVSRTVIPLTKK